MVALVIAAASLTPTLLPRGFVDHTLDDAEIKVHQTLRSKSSRHNHLAADHCAYDRPVSRRCESGWRRSRPSGPPPGSRAVATQAPSYRNGRGAGIQGPDPPAAYADRTVHAASTQLPRPARPMSPESGAHPRRPAASRPARHRPDNAVPTLAGCDISDISDQREAFRRFRRSTRMQSAG